MNETLSVTYSTFRDWFDASFDDERCVKALRYGFASGAAGLIWPSETTPVYERHRADIWAIVIEHYGTVEECIAGMRVESPCRFEMIMVRTAAEQLALSRLESKRQRAA